MEHGRSGRPERVINISTTAKAAEQGRACVNTIKRMPQVFIQIDFLWDNDILVYKRDISFFTSAATPGRS